MAIPLDPWERARRGQHTAVLGLPLSDPPQDLRIVRVSCDVPPTTLGPLLEARSHIERVLGTSAPLVEMARTRMMTGLRRHLLGDLPSVTSEGSLVDVCNRLAALGPSALVLDAVDAADPASLDMLRHILGRPGWLRLPLVLVLRPGKLSAAAAALVEQVRSAAGEEAVLAPEQDASADNGPMTTPLPPAVKGFDPRTFPPDVLRVLRALAIAGSGCEASILAAALEMSELAVVEAMQRAADAGAPIEDRGEARFHLPERAIHALRASILPSFAAALHRRVAAIVAQERAPSTAVDAERGEVPALEPSSDGPRPGNAWDVIEAEPPATLRLPGAEAARSEDQRKDDGPAAHIRAEAERAAEQAADEASRTDPLGATTDPVVAETELRADIAEARGVREDTRTTDASELGRAEDSPLSPDDEAARVAEETAIHAVEEARLAADAAAMRDAIERAAADEADRAAEEAATHAAEEAAAHAAHEARRAAEVSARAEAAERRAAEEAASHAVERAQRELAAEEEEARDRKRAPVYYKPFAGEVRPSPEPRQAPWLSPKASEPRDVRPSSSRDGRQAPQTPTSAHASAAPVEDDARAARHLAAAGDAEAAIQRYFDAVQRAAAAAAYPQAVAHAQAGLALLERLPPTEARRLQRVQFLLEAGRVLWHGSGAGDSFTLPGALRVLESARTSLHAGDPVELLADVAVTIAGVLYEIGDLPSLTRALEELATASRLLAEAGMPGAAARLFNDQASVLIRLGDPVRAAHLLTESRKIFEAGARTDPIATVEMAETDHLFARILLHVPARPGRADDAMSLALDHAMASERAFRRFGAPREAARVLETMGRIELRKGRLARAADRITEAVKIQESIGDVVGLARSTAALSDVLLAGGQIREALNLLADSMVLNFEKGSPLGLAFNRRTIETLAKTDAVEKAAPELLTELATRLAAMEKTLGRVAIPGSPEPSP